MRPSTAKVDSASEERREPQPIVYGDCLGPASQYVKLISTDGHEFILKREYAVLSGTIEGMMSGPGVYAENETNQIRFKNIESHVLSEICKYLAYKHKYAGKDYTIPEFNVEPEMTIDLLMASQFLEC